MHSSQPAWSSFFQSRVALLLGLLAALLSIQLTAPSTCVAMRAVCAVSAPSLAEVLARRPARDGVARRTLGWANEAFANTSRDAILGDAGEGPRGQWTSRGLPRGTHRDPSRSSACRSSRTANRWSATCWTSGSPDSPSRPRARRLLEEARLALPRAEVLLLTAVRPRGDRHVRAQARKRVHGARRAA